MPIRFRSSCLKFHSSSGEQLVEHSRKLGEFVVAPRGTKFSQPIDDPDENAAVFQNNELLDNFREMLSFERVAIASNVSKGVYEPNQSRVKVLTCTGKWQVNFGYVEENVMYLKPYEALQLIEMGKLQVSFDEVIVSVEQAYALFLRVEDGMSHEEYSVFSHLSRAGYHVFQYDPEAEAQKFAIRNTKTAVSNEDEMIWCILMEKLNLPVPAPFIQQEYQLYQQTKKSMQDLCEKISGKRDDPSSSNPVSSEGQREKRNPSPEGETSSKKLKQSDADNESQSSNFLDILKQEPEYLTNKHIFDTFSFIKRRENFDSVESKLKYSFDVYLPNANFKRTEDLPNYRLIVIR